MRLGQFPSPRSLRPQFPGALEAICLKAMALKPQDRYPSARGLAGEIENWLADEHVVAYREPLLSVPGGGAAPSSAGHRDLGGRGRALVALGILTAVISLSNLCASPPPT